MFILSFNKICFLLIKSKIYISTIYYYIQLIKNYKIFLCKLLIILINIKHILNKIKFIK